jgi:hypothetical protein
MGGGSPPHAKEDEMETVVILVFGFFMLAIQLAPALLVVVAARFVGDAVDRADARKRMSSVLELRSMRELTSRSDD